MLKPGDIVIVKDNYFIPELINKKAVVIGFGILSKNPLVQFYHEYQYNKLFLPLHDGFESATLSGRNGETWVCGKKNRCYYISGIYLDLHKKFSNYIKL